MNQSECGKSQQIGRDMRERSEGKWREERKREEREKEGREWNESRVVGQPI